MFPYHLTSLQPYHLGLQPYHLFGTKKVIVCHSCKRRQRLLHWRHISWTGRCLRILAHGNMEKPGFPGERSTVPESEKMIHSTIADFFWQMFLSSFEVSFARVAPVKRSFSAFESFLGTSKHPMQPSDSQRMERMISKWWHTRCEWNSPSFNRLNFPHLFSPRKSLKVRLKICTGPCAKLPTACWPPAASCQAADLIQGQPWECRSAQTSYPSEHSTYPFADDGYT